MRLVISIRWAFLGVSERRRPEGFWLREAIPEALNDADTVIFDKTGTLTTGIFKVTDVIGRNGFTKEEVLKYGAYAEYHSTHPIAVSIKAKYLENTADEIEADRISDMAERAGFGIKAQIGGKSVLAGKLRLMQEEHVAAAAEDAAGTDVYVAVVGCSPVPWL